MMGSLSPPPRPKLLFCMLPAVSVKPSAERGGGAVVVVAGEGGGEADGPDGGFRRREGGEDGGALAVRRTGEQQRPGGRNADLPVHGGHARRGIRESNRPSRLAGAGAENANGEAVAIEGAELRHAVPAEAELPRGWSRHSHRPAGARVQVVPEPHDAPGPVEHVADVLDKPNVARSYGNEPVGADAHC